MAISHAEAALTETVFWLLRKRFWVDTGSERALLSATKAEHACPVGDARHYSGAFQFFPREGFEGFGTNMNFALQGGGLAITTRLSDGDELNYRLLPPGYNDFFPSASFLDEAGKLSFRFVNGDRFHGSV